MSDIPITPPPPRDFMDRAMRWLLESPGNLRGLLLVAVPRLADRIDYDHITVLSRTFIDEEFRKLEADLVVRAPYRPLDGSEARDVWVYVLIEHQSDPDSLIPFRFLTYMLRVWKGELEEQANKGVPRGKQRLTPILPVVFYTGQRPWESPGSLTNLVEVPTELAGFLPRYDMVFLNVGETDPAQLKALEDAMGSVLLLLQEKGPVSEMLRLLNEALGRLVALEPVERDRYWRLLWFVVGSIHHCRPAEDHEVLLRAVKGAMRDPARVGEVETMAKTYADELVEKGEVGALRKTLLRLLRAKFGAVPEDVERRVQAIEDVARLGGLLERILTATSLAEMNL